MLKGKVVLITGGSRGIGAQTAKSLTANGASVIVNYSRDSEKAEALIREVGRKKGGRIVAIKADVSKEAESKKMMKEIIRDFKSIDVIVNNASAPTALPPFNEIQWGSFQKHLDVALRGAFNTIKNALPYMTDAKKGKIVNVLTSYTIGAPPSKPIDYISAKYALLGFSKALAVELGPLGITVNCVSPGMTQTDMLKDLPAKLKEMTAFQTPLKRLAQPIDIARVILFLCSESADYITGANIPVCGGITM